MPTDGRVKISLALVIDLTDIPRAKQNIETPPLPASDDNAGDPQIKCIPLFSLPRIVNRRQVVSYVVMPQFGDLYTTSLPNQNFNMHPYNLCISAVTV